MYVPNAQPLPVLDLSLYRLRSPMTRLLSMTSIASMTKINLTLTPKPALTPHAVDPWFNFRATKYLVKNGFYSFWDWFDDRTWHPLGRVTGGTLYPGLMVTSGVIYHVLRLLSIPVDIRNICVLPGSCMLRTDSFGHVPPHL